MTDFVDETRKEIARRLQELEPLVDEFNRLEAAVVALARRYRPEQVVGARAPIVRTTEAGYRPAWSWRASAHAFAHR